MLIVYVFLNFIEKYDKHTINDIYIVILSLILIKKLIKQNWKEKWIFLLAVT